MALRLAPRRRAAPHRVCSDRDGDALLRERPTLHHLHTRRLIDVDCVDAVVGVFRRRIKSS
jgi:hypothetical protein